MASHRFNLQRSLLALFLLSICCMFARVGMDLHGYSLFLSWWNVSLDWDTAFLSTGATLAGVTLTWLFLHENRYFGLAMVCVLVVLWFAAAILVLVHVVSK